MKKLLILFLFLFINVNLTFAEEKKPDIKIQKIEDDIYLHTSFEHYDGFGLVASNGLVVTDNKNAYIIDTPTSPEGTKKLMEWFVARGFTPKASISTHFHDDSTAGIEWLNSQSIPTYASSMTNKLLEQADQTQAKNSFDETSFWLVKGLVEVFYPGPGHTKDNVVVWLPKQGVLFGGCFVKSENLGNLADAVLEVWPESAENLISRYGNARLVVPGHGDVGDVSLLQRTKALALEGLASRNSSQSGVKASAD